MHNAFSFLSCPIQGVVNLSSWDKYKSASALSAPHICVDGCRLPQTAGRSGFPKIRQRPSSSSCMQGTPAGLPPGMPGIGEEIEGAMQQAAQPALQLNAVEIISFSTR
jgi:hypothetical protein